MVADGIGGLLAGEVAASRGPDCSPTYHHTQIHRVYAPEEVLLEAMYKAHHTIAALSRNDPLLQGMGTTAVVAWQPYTGSDVWVTHVGIAAHTYFARATGPDDR